MSMMRRRFATERIERAPGRFVHAHVVICGQRGCPNKQHLFFTSGPGTPDDVVLKKFQQKGWHIDRNDSLSDRCPYHTERGHGTIRVIPANGIDTSKAVARLAPPKETTMPSNVTPLSSTAQQPTISDRRLILSKLDEVYLDEARGYKTPWNDEAVAKDLGTPVEWVRTIRSENFGPLNSNGELQEMITKLRALCDEGWKIVEELQKLGPQVARALAIKPELEKIDRRLSEITGK